MSTPATETTPMPGAPSHDNFVSVPEVVSAEQVEFFVENGFLVLDDLMAAEEIEELKADTVAVARGQYQCEGITAAPADYSDQQVLESILCIHQPHHVSPVMEKYVRHEKICGALSQITAAHLAHWDGSVKCMQSMLFVKPPGFQGQAWHQDEIYIPTRDRSLVGAWIAMDDATIENGCLWVIPGSHKTGYLYPQRKHDNEDEFDFAPESYGFDESAEVPVEVKAGAVVFFNGYLLHRSRKNRSQIYRRVLVNHYMNAWSKLPWHLLDGESVARADRRTIIPVAGVDPYAWPGLTIHPTLSISALQKQPRKKQHLKLPTRKLVRLNSFPLVSKWNPCNWQTSLFMSCIELPCVSIPYPRRTHRFYFHHDYYPHSCRGTDAVFRHFE